MASAIEELNFEFYLVLIGLNSSMWPVATVLGPAGLQGSMSVLWSVWAGGG